MNERFAAFWDAVKAWWERLSRIGRTLFIVAGGVIIIAIIALIAVSSNRPVEYALLYDDLNTS
jgi:flagellar biosynthesis/type III secretory pathway M-ring protein FliF/YscJ